MSTLRWCRKCGAVVYAPRYEVGAHGDHLRYECRCGYSWTEPCKDAPKETKE